MDLNEFHEIFIQDIDKNRQITGSTFEEEFFDTYVNYLIENDEMFGETSFIHFEMPLSYNQRASISGYSYNDQDAVLNLFLVDSIDYNKKVSTISYHDAERLYKRARNFFTQIEEIAREGEESNEAVNLSKALFQSRTDKNNEFYDLASVKIFIFTDKKLTRNLVKIDDVVINGTKIYTQIVGIERIQNLSESRKGKIDLKIDLTKFKEIPAIKANETSEYESYLCNINGLILAQLYNEYGSRLIESNVRSFLQTRGKVNKGIRLTILKEPEKFFAYNNGLTCTAKSIKFDGKFISEITGFQIVNGGQTTASLTNVMLNDKGSKENLKKVFVPMKLNVINSVDIEDELVPDISRFANSQNKVSDADLASNHPFHKKIENFSRKTSTPASDGFSHGTYWYYERASGQYAQETYKMPASQKNRFLDLNPKNQVFKKSDFAKYFSIFYQRPDIASKGGASAFKNFSSWIINTWDKNPNSVNLGFYKEMISNIIIFKKLDKITRIGAGSNGYKANVNAYTLSFLYWYIESVLDSKFDYSQIWKRQSVSQHVIMFLDDVSYKVRDVLTRVEGNVTEYAKKINAWEDVKKLIVLDKKYDLSSIITSKFEASESKKDAIKDEKFENDIFDTANVYEKIEENPDYYKNLLIFIDSKINDFSPKERGIIAMLATNKYLTDKQSKVALKAIEKAELDGFDL